MEPVVDEDGEHCHSGCHADDVAALPQLEAVDWLQALEGAAVVEQPREYPETHPEDGEQHVQDHSHYYESEEEDAEVEAGLPQQVLDVVGPQREEDEGDDGQHDEDGGDVGALALEAEGSELAGGALGLFQLGRPFELGEVEGAAVEEQDVLPVIEQLPDLRGAVDLLLLLLHQLVELVQPEVLDGVLVEGGRLELEPVVLEELQQGHVLVLVLVLLRQPQLFLLLEDAGLLLFGFVGFSLPEVLVGLFVAVVLIAAAHQILIRV